MAITSELALDGGVGALKLVMALLATVVALPRILLLVWAVAREVSIRLAAAQKSVKVMKEDASIGHSHATAAISSLAAEVTIRVLGCVVGNEGVAAVLGKVVGRTIRASISLPPATSVGYNSQ